MSRYAELGVDASKADVRAAFEEHIDNDFPGAWVNIIKDPHHLGEVFTQHMDGNGSKYVQRLLAWEETGDPRFLLGAVDDALQMNLGDIAASGFVFDTITVTDVINVNGQNAPKNEIMRAVGTRIAELLELHRQHGFEMYFLGGETGDLPDQVSSVVFDVAVHARAKETDIVRGNVQPGDKIFGFASDGQAAWENSYNSGIMSNGLTLARNALMSAAYNAEYPYLTRREGAYDGGYRVEDQAEGFQNHDTVNDAIISPTRQWSLLIRDLLQRLKDTGAYESLHGISLNTGGGATKVGHLGSGVTFRKRMPTPPEIFRLINREAGEKWRDMFEGFNCGVGVDVVGADNPLLIEALQAVAEETGVRLFELGECEPYKGDGKNGVVLETDYGTFDYDIEK